MKEVITEDNAIELIDALKKILVALYDKPNVLAMMLSDFNQEIQSQFPEGKISEHAKDVLRLGQEAAAVRKKNYSAKIYQQLGNQRQILDTDVLRIINELRYQPDWVSLCVCVALAVGSRLIEILRVSTYVEVENPLYIEWKVWQKIELIVR